MARADYFSPFVPIGDNRFKVLWAAEDRAYVLDLAEQLDQVRDQDAPELRRLFPTAYPDDPERDAGFQILARSDRIDQRREQLDILRRTADADEMSDEELGAWMGLINDLRLVLGTTLDVSEDDEEREPPEDPQMAASLALYQVLSWALSHIVDALTGTLPEPESDH